MPGDYDGNTNQFKNNSVIPPELQSIIDKVSGMSMSVGRKAGLLADLGGQVGGLERQRMSDTSSMARLGVEGVQKTGLEQMQQTGAMERTKLSTQPGLMEATERTKPQFDTGSLSPTSSAKGIGAKSGGFGAWNNNDQYHKLFGNWS